MTLLSRILHGSVAKLIRVACYLALIGLAMLCYSMLSPGALPVIGAMSIGHAIGIGALACYLLAILIDEARLTRPIRTLSSPEATEEASEPPPGA
jgi:hypothetical protein